MTKRLAVLAGVLAVLFVAAVPALAQGDFPEGGPKEDTPPTQEATPKEEPKESIPPGPPPDRTATLSFELAVEGEPLVGAKFLGFVPAEGGIRALLTDPDGNGLYTGSVDVPRFPPGPIPPGAEPVSLPIQIVQSNATGPGTLEIIRDFGEVLIDGDKEFSASVSFPDNGGGPDEVVTVTYELTIDGEVPEGKLLGVDTGIADVAHPVFCSTADFDNLPFCEDGETYSDTFEVPVGSPFSYEYTVFDYGFGGVVETFAGDTRRFTEDDTVSASYRPGDPGNTVEIVEAAGVLEKPEITSYQYGTHAISDEAGTDYALRSNTADLDEYVGERVTVYGALVSGFEDGQIEGGPPLMNVYKVEPAGGSGEDTVVVEFELAVEGEPPADATFFGYLGYEPAPLRLTDPDGDGVYTGSTPPSLVPAGDTQPALIVQGTGTRESQVVGSSPGDPITTLKDFGEVTFEEDTTLSASVSFEDSNGGSGNVDSNNGAGIRGFLPSTGGGMALTVLGAGVLLIGGGLLVRRLTR